ncbi:ribonuclease H-like domain-containing protein [Vararia minispora EC-137]|uniref:Ribonuclease H-like domain-containing protein n=1 Tax=Vararia minispora EC-137 TaxID=1314806 RepID=A0ACB8QEL2_9AGAM|nr:ribonuclease H-like domain-containing protein [Vararia minispora EC-137]
MSASSNWLALQKKIGSPAGQRKRRKLSHEPGHAPSLPLSPSSSLSRAAPPPVTSVIPSLLSDTTEVNGETLGALRSMVCSSQELRGLPEKDRLPGTYIAIDCEMVGVGPNGLESSLARVSAVNYAGFVLFDSFVRQRERVTDWRTQWSGIRPGDMSRAKPFNEVQKTVSDLLNGRILVGHALHNDLQALMLPHPRAQTRDTQLLAYRHGQTKNRLPALRNLVKDMLGIAIQEGEHNSIVDARATMAIYRLHRKQWDQAFNIKPIRVKLEMQTSEKILPYLSSKSKRKRKQEPKDDKEDNQDHEYSFSPVQSKKQYDIKVAKSGAVQRKGISSGLSVVVKQNGKKRAAARGPSGAMNWWEKTSVGGSSGAIQSMTSTVST